MAITYEYPLTGSKGIPKVVYFYGLDFPIVISPTIHGEPLLTTQAFYYLEQLESVVKLRFNNPNDIPIHNSREELERKFEYIIDNYLFIFSKKHPSLKLTSKITDYKYWKNEDSTYLGYDENNTLALALDTLNDDSIIDVKNNDFTSKGHWYDWCLISNYTNEYIENYISSMKSIIKKTVNVELDEHRDIGSGKYTLPLLRCNKGLIDFHQAQMLEVINTDKLNNTSSEVLVSRGLPSNSNFTLPVEVFNTTVKYNADLLSYYFAGVREHLPISKFRSFYNVLEYFFEDAPIQIGETARIEREQISCVIRWASDNLKLKNFITALGSNYITKIENNLVSSTGITINAISIDSQQLAIDISEWLYSIRCACIHSKKTRKGNVSARLVPYSNDEELVAIAVPLIQQLAIECIELEIT